MYVRKQGVATKSMQSELFKNAKVNKSKENK